MQKYFGGLLSACLAILCLAFSSTKSEGPDCETSSFYWFRVKLGSGKTTCNSVTRSNFVEILDPNQNGFVDPGEIVSLAISGDLIQGNDDAMYLGCDEIPLYVCALSYDLSSMNSISVIKNASNQWIFVPATPSSLKCCLKRQFQ